MFYESVYKDSVMANRVWNEVRRFLKRTGIRKGLIGGVLVLLIVDLLWVGSAALSRVSGRGQNINNTMMTLDVMILGFVSHKQIYKVKHTFCTYIYNYGENSNYLSVSISLIVKK